MSLPDHIHDLDPAPVDVDAELVHLLGREHEDADVTHLDPRYVSGRVAEDVDAITVAVHYASDDDETPDEDRPWRIRTVDDAEWCMVRLAAATGDLGRIQAEHDEFVAKAKRWFWKVAPRTKRTIAYFTAQLERWALDQRAAYEAAGAKRYPKTYHVPSGSVGTRGGEDPKVVITDSATVIDWARDALPDVVTTTHDVKVTNLREHTAVIADPNSDDPDDLIVVTRWTDSDGVVHTGTDPIPGAGVEHADVTATPKPNLLPEELL